MDLSSLESTLKASGGGIILVGLFYWDALSPVIPNKHHLNTTTYLKFVDGGLFKTTVF